MMRKFWDGIISIVDILSLVISLSLVFGIWYFGITHDNTTKHLVEDVSIDVKEGVGEKIEHLFDYANAVRAFVESSDDVTNEEFANFVQTLFAREHYLYLSRIVIFEKVNNVDIKKFEERFEETNGATGYKVEVDENSDWQYIMTHISDGSGNVVENSGVNLRKFKDRVPLIEKLEKGNNEAVALLDPVEGSQIKEHPMVMLVPIIKQNNIQGIVALAVDAKKLIESVSNLSTNVDMKFYQGDKTILNNLKEKYMKPVESIHKISLDNDRVIDFEVKSENHVQFYWNWVLGIGAFFSFVIYLMVYSLSLSGLKARELAVTMTSDLQKYKYALDSNNSHVIITDSSGKVIYANDAVTRLTGYSNEEVVGANPRLWGGQMTPEFYANFWDVIKNKKQVFRGEVTNMRKDGTLYIAEAIVSPIIVKDELIGFVGTETDITGRKKQEEGERKHSEEIEKLNDLMVDRELKMKEMKKQLQILTEKTKV